MLEMDTPCLMTSLENIRLNHR